MKTTFLIACLILLPTMAFAFEVFEIERNVVVNYGKESRILRLPEQMRTSSSYVVTLYPAGRSRFVATEDLLDKDVGVMLAKANDLFHKDKLAEAIDILTHAESVEPYNYRVKNMFGSIFYKLEDFQAARKYWTDSLKLNEKQPLVKKYLNKLPKEKMQSKEKS